MNTKLNEKSTSVKLNDKKIAHGKLPDGPLCIDDILGRRHFMYDEATVDEYQTKLEKMNLSDLQRHAIEVANIIPNVDKRDSLINKLVKVYLERKFKYVGTTGSINPVVEPPEEIKAILRRGK